MSLFKSISQKTEEKIEMYERSGFWFYPSWTMDSPITPDRIQMPSESIMSTEEIDLELNNLSRVSSLKRIRELRLAVRYYDLIRSLDADERYSRYNQSFIDDADMINCEERYKDAVVFP